MKCKKILTALLAAACTMSGCHGDLDIMQDNKLSASNMWIDESDAETATYGIYLIHARRAQERTRHLPLLG